jgi:hypothetical protein
MCFILSEILSFTFLIPSSNFRVAAIHTYPRAAVTIQIISERNLQQQQQQPPPKETGYDYTPSPPPMKKSHGEKLTQNL